MCKNTCVSNKKCMQRGKEKLIQGQMQPHHFRFLKVNQYLNPTAVSNYIFKYPMESSQTTRLHIAQSRTAVPARWASINVSTFLEKMKQHSGEDYGSWHSLYRHAAAGMPISHHSSNYLAVICQWIPPSRVLRTLTLPVLWGVNKVQLLGGRESKNEAHVCGGGSAELQTLKRACLCLEWKRNMYLARAGTTHYIFITE